jgi:adenine-specific DNA-methyltransferase
MDKILEILKETLQEGKHLGGEGDFLKNKIVELALKQDKDLIRLLLKNERLKEVFFMEIDKVLIFDKEKLVHYVSNKQFLPDSYTTFKNKIGLVVEGEFIRENKDVVLSWPYKDCILEGGMTKEDQKRDEIFWNEILAPDEISRLFDPKVITNVKRIDNEGEQKLSEFNTNHDGFIQDSLIIKGNNLLSLYSLKEQFAGKIKLIYIDPPYNTPGDANTFNYNNSFNHSTWLTFMKNRLVVSKALLKDDGVIAIAIDDVEQAYLKVMCDEIFGRENFIGTLVIQSKPGGRSNDTYLATSHEYVLFYSKIKGLPQINFFELPDSQKQQYKHGDGEDSFKWRDFIRTGGYSTPEERPNSYYPIYYCPDNNDIALEKFDESYIEIFPIDSNGKKRVWRKVPDSLKKHIQKNEIKIVKNKNNQWKVKIIDRIKEGVRPSSVWIDSRYDASTHGTKLLKEMFDGEKVFSFPKSIHSVQDVIEIFTEKEGNDIILDFFAGSGTTAEAVINLNNNGSSHQFIMCEQMDYAYSVTAERVKRIMQKQDIKSSFVYMELARLNENYIDRINKAKTSEDLLGLWATMKERSFLSYKVNIKSFDENIEEFENLSINNQKRFLLECLDKNHLYINYSDIDDTELDVDEETKRINQEFYKHK